MGVKEFLIESLLEFYQGLKSLMPDNLQMIPPLVLLTVGLSLFGIFTWFFYKSISKREVLKLNLEQYNTYQNATLVKVVAVLLYITEFIVISPIIIFLWFAVFSIFLIFLANELNVGTIFLISAAFICTVRITAFFREKLSEDLAKFFPLALLGTVILTPSFFTIETTINRISQIPLVFSHTVYYFLFILGLEIILRFTYLPFAILRSEEDEEEEKEE